MEKDTITAITSILSASTALVAVFAGPWIASRLQRRQAVSAMREKWIQDLRLTLSDFISIAESLASLVVQSRSINDDFREKHDALVRLAGKSQMMLNGNESTHKALGEGIDRILALGSDESVKPEEKMEKMRELTQSVIPVSQLVFKEAWDKASK